VGAGPTGVELSSALVSYLRRIARMHGIASKDVHINLIEAAPRILPRMSEAAATMVAKRLKKLGVTIMTGKKVEANTPDALMVDGKALPTATTIWTAGVTNHPFYEHNADNFTFDKRHKVVVDDHLQAAPDIYVLGDHESTQFSGLAQVAVADGKFVAKHHIRRMDGKPAKKYPGPRPIPFIPVGKGPITVVPVGQNWALVEYGNFVTSSLVGWWLRRMADFLGYWDVMPFFMAMTLWTADRSEAQDCAACRITY
jgi:NADH:ubiquinone reductase (H+-translocating)